MKKLIAMALVAGLLALTSIGCGGGDTKSGSSSGKTGATSATSGKTGS